MDWKEENNQLVKEFTLDGFSAIANAIPQIAEAANAMNHHPDFEVYDYKHIRFKLMTHAAGKVTDMDYALAKEIDRILEA